MGRTVTRVGLGFRPHSGWSTVVAVAREGATVRVVERCQVEMVGPELPGQVYHAAAGLRSRDEAAELVRRVEEAARAAAIGGVREVVGRLREAGREPLTAGVPIGAMAVPSGLEQILSRHTLLHAAEGELYAQAMADAADRCGLAVSLVPSADLGPLGARELGLAEPALKGWLTELGRELGPPWRRDEKDATLAAVLGLRAAGAGAVPRVASRQRRVGGDRATP